MTRVCVITGGTRGIGAAAAARLAGPESALVLAFRSDEGSARRLADRLSVRGEVVPVRCDVADADQVARLFRVVDRMGVLTGLVNSAGFAEQATTFENIEPDRWARVLATNVIGTAICCREAVVRMRASDVPDRAIVNLSSRAAVLGSPGEWVDYAASKAAVDTLTRGLALEVANAGIRVNAVRPGLIATDFHAAAGAPTRVERLAPAQPMPRAGSAEEVASAIVWLLSSDASYVTGATLDVSGGR